MKKLLLLLVTSVLLFGSSCKKTEINNYPTENVGTKTDVLPAAGEVTLTQQAEIEALTWTVVEHYSAYNGDTRMIKLVSGKYTITIKKVPSDIFWSPRYADGNTMPGAFAWSLYIS